MHQDDVDQDILPGADAEKVRLTAVALLHTKLIATDQTRSKLPFCCEIYNPVHFNTRLGIENRNKFNRDEGNATG
jgi:hypothetical protein